ncbi:MAG: FtsX-like permease family protein [Candidatus Thorarchaeota archaeon]
MYLLSRIRSSAPEILVAFLIFSLSSGVVGGVIVYLDSIGPDVLSEMSQEVPVDMQVNFHESFYDQNETTVESLRNLVLEQDYVSDAECISFIEVNDRDLEVREYTRSAVLGIDETFENTFPKSISFSEGNIPLNESNCYLQRSRLEDEGLVIGDDFTISIPLDSGRLNRTFVIAGTFESDLFQRRITYDAPTFSYLYVIIQRNALLNQFSSLEHFGENCVVNRIWVRFDSGELLIRDPTSIVPKLRSIEKQLEQKILPDASVVDFALIGVFYEYSMWATGMRIIALAFSIPSIIMAVMLIQYNSNLEAEEQRRSVGALKTRGASGRQALQWILSMSIFIGFVGSIGAILAGTAAAFLAGGVRELMIFDVSQISSFVIVFQPQTLILLFLFSFVAGLLVTIPTAIRALLMSPTEAHSIVKREETRPRGGLGNPVYQVGIVALSGALLIPLVSSLESFTDLSVGSAFVGIIVLILLAILIVGLTFLLARPSARLKSRFLLRINRPSLIVGCRILGKNATAFTRNEAAAVMFISLVFTAGIFSALAATSGNEHMKDLFMFNVGADIVADVKSNLENVTLDLLDDILAIDGVAQATGILKTSARVTYLMDWNGHLYPFNRSLLIYGVQPVEYSETAFLRPEFGYYGNPKETIPRLQQSEENVVTNFKPVVEYESDSLGNSYPVLSDFIGVELLGPTGKHIINCTIINVLASSPSTAVQGIYGETLFRGASYLPGEELDAQFVMLDIDTLYKYLNISYVNRFYLDLMPGSNYTEVMSELGNIAPFSFENMKSPYTQIDAILDSRAGESIYGAYTLNILFSILYLTAGVTLVVTMKVRNLRKHFSLLRALGAQPISLLRAMILDTIIGVIIGVVMGSLVGTILTYIILQIPLTYLGLSSEVTWERLPLVLSIPWSLIVAIVSIALVFSTIISILVMRRGLRSNIANDIQHSE